MSENCLPSRPSCRMILLRCGNASDALWVRFPDCSGRISRLFGDWRITTGDRMHPFRAVFSGRPLTEPIQLLNLSDLLPLTKEHQLGKNSPPSPPGIPAYLNSYAFLEVIS